jgi:hypothetical protein
MPRESAPPISLGVIPLAPDDVRATFAVSLEPVEGGGTATRCIFPAPLLAQGTPAGDGGGLYDGI